MSYNTAISSTVSLPICYPCMHCTNQRGKPWIKTCNDAHQPSYHCWWKILKSLSLLHWEQGSGQERLEQSQSSKGSGTNRKYSVVVMSHAMSTTWLVRVATSSPSEKGYLWTRSHDKVQWGWKRPEIAWIPKQYKKKCGWEHSTQGKLWVNTIPKAKSQLKFYSRPGISELWAC